MTAAEGLAPALLNSTLVKLSPRRHYVAVESSPDGLEESPADRFPGADPPDLSDDDKRRFVPGRPVFN
jgi:hypothetical protein